MIHFFAKRLFSRSFRLLFLFLLVAFLITFSVTAASRVCVVTRAPRSYHLYHVNSLIFNRVAFQPPEPDEYRFPDNTDTFERFKYRSTCNISSLDLHAAFSPLCVDRQSMLAAMSSGGRVGHDAPYMPRECDMRWFKTEEICEILSRFGKVIFVGNSMMRRDCFCNYQFNAKACSIQGIFKTEDVMKNDPDSVACPAGTIDVMIEQMVRYPIPQEELDRFRDALGARIPKKPFAFIFGHGLWNDLDLQATTSYLDTLLAVTTGQLPYLSSRTAFWPRLLITPNAAGRHKPDEWLVSQGNKALMAFEESAKIIAERRGVEHLGTWNMSIHANKYDGVHLDLKGNLVKAMMVMNWLDLLEIEQHYQ